MIDINNIIGIDKKNENTVCLLDAILPDLHDGAQLWDTNGHLLSCNNATISQFGKLSVEPGFPLKKMLERASDENGLPVKAKNFPVNKVYETGHSQTGFIMQVAGGESSWLKASAYPLLDCESKIMAVLSFTHEISSLVEKGKQLELDAYYDSLTGLPNRLLLPDRMKQAMAHSQRAGEILAICMLDLDGFKEVNDTMGHHAGDQLLREVARRFSDNLRSDDTALRLGGDEFILLMGGFEHETQTLDAIQRMLNTIGVPYQITGKTVHVTASIGVTLYPSDAVVSDQLIRHADQAMYKAKEEGKNRFHLFDPAIESKIRANKQAVNSIGKAIEKDQLNLYFQPKVDCIKGKVVGLEATIRWEHPVLGIIPPAEFLPLIEHDNMIIRLGEWVIEHALQQIRVWLQQGIDIKVSVNIAARHLLRGNFQDLLEKLLIKFPRECVQHLEIEILETAALEDINTVSKLIDHYRQQGISFALDDFGTGYSSLAHLKHLTADSLKIDRSFVRDMHSDPGDLGIIQGIIGLAEAFEREVIAEGVESIEQVLLLIELGCSIMQGYGIAYPMAAEKIPKWLNTFKPDPRWRLAHNHYPDRTDFELLLLQVTHRQWMDKIQEIDSNWKDFHPVDYHECRITKWYEKEEMKPYLNSPELRKIIADHRKVHRYAEQLTGCDSKNNPQTTETIRHKLSMASEALMDDLYAFRETISPGMEQNTNGGA